MEKVLLSKEEAAALNSVLEVCGGDRAAVSQWHSQNLWDGEREPLNHLDLETVNLALYVGFDIGTSPEEKVLEYYKSIDTQGKCVIVETLTFLNINIPGINY